MFAAAMILCLSSDSLAPGHNLWKPETEIGLILFVVVYKHWPPVFPIQARFDERLLCVGLELEVLSTGGF